MATHDATAAVLTLNDPANYSAKGKKSILAWLKRQERYFSKNSKKMSKRYRAHYIYQEED